MIEKNKGGRPKGSLGTKAKQFDAALDKCKKKPHELLLESLDNQELPITTRIGIAEKLMRFYLPVKKESTVEITDKRKINEMTPAELVAYIDEAKQVMKAA